MKTSLLILLVLFFSSFSLGGERNESLFSNIDRVLSRAREDFQPSPVKPVVYAGGSSRQEFFKLMYGSGLIEASDVSRSLRSKVVSHEVFLRLLGERYLDFFPFALGDWEAIERLQGPISTHDIAAAQQLLETWFPNGVIAKPADSEAVGGKEFISGALEVAQFLMDLEEKSELGHYLLQAKAGVTYLLDDVVGPSVEVRVHSLHDKVVRGMSTERWFSKISKAEITEAEDFVQELLLALPPALTARQAWAFDVLINRQEFEKIALKRRTIIDFNTNGGEPGSWSGALASPLLLGQFARYLEQQHGWTFVGWPALRLRYSAGNLREVCEKLFEMGQRSFTRLGPER